MGFFFKKTSTVSLSIDVRTTMIRYVVYLLRIFKMFHGLMNNPVDVRDACVPYPWPLYKRLVLGLCK